MLAYLLQMEGMILLKEERDVEITMKPGTWDLGLDHQVVRNLAHLRKMHKDRI